MHPGRSTHRWVLVAGFLLVVVLPALLAAPASAHAVLVSSSPADGARLARSPGTVRLHFDEDVELVRSGSGVLADSGRSVLRARARLDGGSEVVLPLRAGLPHGSYTASWRVVSADGHVVTGSIRFGVRVDPSARPTTRPDPVAPAVLGAVARSVGYVGAVLMVGVPLTAVVLWPGTLRLRRTRRIQVWGTVLLTLGSLLDLVQRGPAATGSGLGGVWRLDGLGLVMHTHDGRLLLARIAVCLVAGPGIALLSRRQSGPLRSVVVTTWVLVVVSLAWTGHALVGALSRLAVLSAVLHVAAMTTWLGGLVLLIAVVLRDQTPAPGSLRAWSRLAMTCVGVLVVTGTVQALRQVHPVASLWTTGYGVVLLAKVALVGVVLCVAQVARRTVLSRSGDGESATQISSIRASVRLELVVLVAVLALTSVLVSRPPARETYGPALARTLPIAAGSVDLAAPHTHRGTQVLSVRAHDRRGRVARLSAVSGTLSAPEAGIGGLRVHFVRGPGQVWHSTDAVLPVAARWTLTVSVQPAGALAYVTQTTYQVW